MHGGRRDRGTLIASLALSVVALGLPGAAFAAGDRFKLALTPVGQDGPYFDLTMRPGDSVGLEVTLANDGAQNEAARTYASDVFTITNGGYGGRLRDAAQTATTTWVEYPSTVLSLRAGEHVRRSLTVTVPGDARPGEYITSLVLENDSAVHGMGDVAFDQFVRQAIAVVITVPGDRAPALELGEASYNAVGGRSIVSVAVTNSGNVRLKPTVDFALSDPTGAVISRASFLMDTFYANTDTHVEVGLETPLPSGSYTVRLSLEDIGQGALSSNQAIPFVVEAGPATPAADGAVPGFTNVDQEADALSSGVPAWVVTLLAGLIVGGMAVGLVVLVVGRRRRA